jgi:hypothetical protein
MHDEVLLQANGLVIDISEKIVVNPLKKVFNYLENGAGLDVQDNKLYECVERFDGFFGCISKHPFKDELLITTESSFESYEVQKIKGFISAEMNSRLLNFLSKNEMTLMFEVIHNNFKVYETVHKNKQVDVFDPHFQWDCVEKLI